MFPEGFDVLVRSSATASDPSEASLLRSRGAGWWRIARCSCASSAAYTGWCTDAPWLRSSVAEGGSSMEPKEKKKESEERPPETAPVVDEILSCGDTPSTDGKEPSNGDDDGKRLPERRTRRGKETAAEANK